MGKGSRKRRKRDTLRYQEHRYRQVVAPGLVPTRVRMMETDLHILAPEEVSGQVLVRLSRLRSQLEEYITQHPSFLTALQPLPLDPGAPPLVQEMFAAGLAAGVGPMAAVAGAIGEAIGSRLREQGMDEVVVENGGDIYVARRCPCTVAIFAGEAALSGRLGIELAPEQMPCGVCTSSASIGHSLSLGQADAAVVIAPSTPLADAAATRLGNMVGATSQSINRALEEISKVPGVRGALVICGDRLGAWGECRLVQVTAPEL